MRIALVLLLSGGAALAQTQTPLPTNPLPNAPLQDLPGQQQQQRFLEQQQQQLQAQQRDLQRQLDEAQREAQQRRVAPLDGGLPPVIP
jgi:peptidoglycan hydrolase CwlO-like protein